MPKVFIGVGSNLGDREKHIQQARDLLGSIRGIRFTQCSRVRETDPEGGPAGQGKYLNAVWQIESELNPQELMGQLWVIEKQLGRERREKNGPRTVDLDILFYDQEILARSELTVPHPRAHERVFVIEPMAELDPNFIHPVLRKTVKEILRGLNFWKRGTGNVRKIRSTFPEDRSPKKYETHPGS